MAILSPAEHGRIAAAIRAAEAQTDGEIFAVLARRSDSYLFVAVAWAALASLLGGFVAALVLPASSALALALGQAAAFAVCSALALPERLRMLLVPRPMQERRAARHAVEQFLAHNLHATAGRTGVLVFVSLAERYAAVIADTAIDARVQPAVWQAIVDRLTADIAAGRLADGMAAAVAAAGAVLAEHFPPTPAAENELADRLVEI